MFTIVGFLCALGSIIMHSLIYCKRISGKSCALVSELVLSLFAVLCTVIGFAFVESQIEWIHDHGNVPLVRFMLANNLVIESQVQRLNATEELTKKDARKLISNLQVEFDLIRSKPKYGIYLLIAGDFLLLLGYFCVLIYLVRYKKFREKRRIQLRNSIMNGSR
ncbi:hypothetical protein Ciccas_006915 [Cichlidogyrus casuarinus]|uniref:Uncharacterized protein n=1 Tax=Cichlidogyrus casuarinus TaxID=1844966 RepID=A0ABD2Q6X0_9PLAT